MAGDSRNLMAIIADLHMHSTYSDGKFEIEKLITDCRGLKLEYFCISDHDTINHISSIQNFITKNNYSINFISGTEITCEFNNSSIHILGYGIDAESNSIISLFKKVKQERFDVIERMGDKLIQHGCDIKFDHILENQNSPGRPHLANELVKNGYADNFNDAFDKWLGKGKPAFVKKWSPSAQEVVDIIHDADGIAMLAHIGIYKFIQNIDDILEIKLDGIEVYHPDHKIPYSDQLLEFCSTHNLIFSGGSDFHGWEEKNNPIASYGLDENSFNQFYEKCLK